MKRGFILIAGAFGLIGLVAAGTLYTYWDQAVPIVGMAINYIRYRSAPAGTLVTELAAPSSVSGSTRDCSPSPVSPPAATSGRLAELQQDADLGSLRAA